MNRSDPEREKVNIALGDHDSAAVAEIAAAFEASGDVDAARELLERACVLWNHPGLWHNLGIARGESNDISGAVDAYTRAIELGSGFDSLVNRGLVLESLDQTEAALADYNAALALNPMDADALVDVGVVHLKLGDLRRAEEYLARAASIDGSANWQLADVFLAQNRNDEALVALNHAIAAGEERARHDRAVLTQDIRTTDEVIEDFQAAIEAGSSAAASDFIVYLDTVADDPRRAAEVGRAAAARGDKLSYSPLAIVLESLGEIEEAILYYRLAVDNGEGEYIADLTELEQRRRDSGNIADKV